mmetsp:Transcript_15593/g.26473  ORF Transcript_15593/g.26473 Transcript_15593/m.26473 type:complete len:209 (+) Transcript_15593:3256-3882(+)
MPSAGRGSEPTWVVRIQTLQVSLQSNRCSPLDCAVRGCSAVSFTLGTSGDTTGITGAGRAGRSSMIAGRAGRSSHDSNLLAMARQVGSSMIFSTAIQPGPNLSSNKPSSSARPNESTPSSCKSASAFTSTSPPTMDSTALLTKFKRLKNASVSSTLMFSNVSSLFLGMVRLPKVSDAMEFLGEIVDDNISTSFTEAGTIFSGTLRTTL